MHHAAALLVFATAMLAAAAITPAQAQTINRCTGTDGSTIYTDRRCRDIGARAMPQRQAAATPVPRMYRGCPRNVQELMHEVGAAIDARDVNRLAGVYHFAGMSSRGAHGVMDRLDAIVQQPLVGISAVQSEAAPVTAPGSYASATFPPLATAAAARRRPVGLRLEQTSGDRITPRSTTLGLRRHMGCWWVSL